MTTGQQWDWLTSFVGVRLNWCQISLSVCSSISGKGICCWVTGRFLTTLFWMYANWKSVEKGSCSAKLAASLGKQLSGGKSGIDVSIFFMAYNLKWSPSVVFLPHLPAQPFLIAWSTPVLTTCRYNCLYEKLKVGFVPFGNNANGYVQCELCTGFMDLVSGRI